MKAYNILLPINKKNKFVKQEGYVLGITLILLTIVLLLITSFLKRQVYQEDWTRTLQQTASKRLVAQNCLVSQKDEILIKYEKILTAVLREYIQLYQPTTTEEREALEKLAAAKAYILTSQSFFYNLPSQANLDSYYLIIQSFSFRTPHLEREYLTNVKSYSYPKFQGGPLILSKTTFVSYSNVFEKVKKIEGTLAQSMMNESLLESIKSLSQEIGSKSLYEIMVEVKVTNSYLATTDREKMYLTLKLQPHEDEQTPYKLTVDEYVLDYK